MERVPHGRNLALRRRSKPRSRQRGNKKRIKNVGCNLATRSASALLLQQPAGTVHALLCGSRVSRGAAHRKKIVIKAAGKKRVVKKATKVGKKRIVVKQPGKMCVRWFCAVAVAAAACASGPDTVPPLPKRSRRKKTAYKFKAATGKKQPTRITVGGGAKKKGAAVKIVRKKKGALQPRKAPKAQKSKVSISTAGTKQRQQGRAAAQQTKRQQLQAKKRGMQTIKVTTKAAQQKKKAQQQKKKGGGGGGIRVVVKR